MLSRRRFLAAASGVFAFAARHRQDALFARPGEETDGAARRCLVLWMNGGPSQLETLDPKPGAATGGPTGEIATATPGLRISEHLPLVARRSEHLAFIRNLTSTEGEHERAQYQMHTGYPLTPSFPRPALGSIVSVRSEAAAFPHFVSFGDRGFGPAFLGPDHAPFAIRQPQEALELLRGLRRRGGRLELLDRLGAEFRELHPVEAVAHRDASLRRIQALVATDFVEALDVSREPLAVRERYGEHDFGQQCLAARRLLQAGVRFVEVQLDGWDTHENNFPQSARLAAAVDRPWAALLDDLHAEGLLAETVVLWLGEFGRTPRINAQQGRDHFPRVTPAAIGGGGLRTGQAVGATDATGEGIDGPSCSVADLFATILATLGTAPDHTFRTSFDSPTPATDDGTPIASLMGPARAPQAADGAP